MTKGIINSELDWYLGSGRSDFLRRGDERSLIPLLVQLEPGTSPRRFAELVQPHIHVPELYTQVLPELDPAFEELDYVTALIDLPVFERMEGSKALSRLPIVEIAVTPPLFRRSHADGKDSKRAEPEPVVRVKGARRDDTAIVGIIDDGIAFAHERFREGRESRVEYFWMQDGPPPGPAGLFGALASGRELRKKDLGPREGIDTLLSRYTFADLVDEDALYRAAGVVDPETPSGHKAILWRRAHGTHVLDIACNTPLASNIDNRIIGVQLPIAITTFPVGTSLAKYVIEGIWYILLRSLSVSQRLGRNPLPVVINISYGLTTGPHDGTHIVERAIDRILPLWSKLMGADVEVVIAAGNHHLDRLHAQVPFPPGIASAEIPWRIQPDDHTPSVVEIWLPAGPPPPPSRVAMRVVAPDGSDTGKLEESLDLSQRKRDITMGGQVICRAEYDYFAASNRGRFRVTVQPTARLEPDSPIAPCGLWRIEFENGSLPAGSSLHAYVALDRAPYGYPPVGRQSYFDDAQYVRFDDSGRAVLEDNASIVKRDGNQNAIATGSIPSVVGGVLRQELKPATYSSGGPTLSPTRYGPDALAVSDDSIVTRGVLGAGSRSGSVVAMDGTSVAAPMITRWVAGELAAGRPAGRAAVQTYAASAEPWPAPHPAQPPPKRGGTGRVILPPSRSKAGDR